MNVRAFNQINTKLNDTARRVSYSASTSTSSSSSSIASYYSAVYYRSSGL